MRHKRHDDDLPEPTPEPDEEPSEPWAFERDRWRDEGDDDRHERGRE